MDYFMINRENLRKTIKPLCITALSFLLFSLLFSSVYVLCSYQSYLKTYSSIQDKEIAEARLNAEGIVSNVEKFLGLTEARIRTAQGESKRIQAILSSTDLLSSQLHLPSIKKFIYQQFIPSMTLINRFGIMLGKEIASKGKGITVDDNIIIIQHHLFNDQGKVAGILEAHIEQNDFVISLGSYQTIKVTVNQEAPAPDNLLTITLIKPKKLWVFIDQQKSHYTVFSLNLGMFLILLVGGAHYMNRYNKKQYQAQIRQLEQENVRLNVEEQEYSNHQRSCQALKKIYSSFAKQERAQVANIAKSLTVLEKSVNDPDFHLTEFEYASILRSCRQDAHSLAQGALSPIRKESLDLEQILEEIWLYFDERIQKSYIVIETHWREDLNLVGDPIFIKFILLNLIGKSLQRVPREGKISVSAFEENQSTCIEIIDNGFSMAVSAEKLVKKAHEFALPEDVFHKTCQEYGLRYEQSRSKGGTYKSILIIPGNKEELEQDNVVQLFK